MGPTFACNGLMNLAAPERKWAPGTPAPRRGAFGGPCVSWRRTCEYAPTGAAVVVENVVYQWFTGS